MAAPKQVRLRVGVIGLGRLWEVRHKPAFARMLDRFRLTAVYDQVSRRAEIEARALGCASSAGIAALIDRRDVDVVYLLSPQWFGLHALGPALESGKPVYCALSLAGEPEVLKALDDRLRDGASVFMPEFARRFYPATLRLRELLATRLGPPRLVVGQVRLAGFDRYGQPGPSTQIVPAPLLHDPGGYLLDWCRFVFQAEPTTVQGACSLMLPTASGRDPDVEAMTLEFPDGGLAQLTIARYHHRVWGDAAKILPTPGLQVYAERGVAWLELPDRIVWTDQTGTYDERLPHEPSVGEALNAHFHRAVVGDHPITPGWHDALAVARLLQRLKRERQDASPPLS